MSSDPVKEEAKSGEQKEDAAAEASAAEELVDVSACIAEEKAASAAAVGERQTLRRGNLCKTGGVNVKSLKSDLKKSTSVVRRLKTFSVDDIGWCMQQAKTLNLTRYMSEIVQSIVQSVVDSKLKASDTPAIAQLISVFACTYKEFGTELVACLQKSLNTTPLLAAPPADSTMQLTGTRALCRLLVELFAIGITDDAKILKKVLGAVTSPAVNGQPPVETLPRPTEKSISLMNLLLKHYGWEVFGLESASMKQASENAAGTGLTTKGQIASWASLRARKEASQPLVPQEDTNLFRNGLRRYLTLALETYAAHKAYVEKLYQESVQIVQHRGELPDDKKSVLRDAKKQLDRLHSAVTQLADALDSMADVPPESDLSKYQSGETSSNITFMTGMASFYAPLDEFGTASLYDDEEQRAFYEDLLELATVDIPEWVASPALRRALLRGMKVPPPHPPSGAASSATDSDPETPDAAQSPAHKTQPQQQPPPQQAQGEGGDPQQQKQQQQQKKPGVSFSTTVAQPAPGRAVPVRVKEKLAEGNKEAKSGGIGDRDVDLRSGDRKLMDFSAVDDLLKRMSERCVGKVATDVWIAQFLTEAFNPASAGVVARPPKDPPAAETAKQPPAKEDAKPAPPEEQGPMSKEKIATMIAFSSICRKRLAKAIFDVNRNAFNLFPQYCRVVATCSEVWRDLAPNVLSHFEDEFDRQLAAQNQLWIEERRKNVRLLCELCKFRIGQPPLLLRCLARLLDNFVHHNIEVACQLVEAAGRFLYRNAQSSVRFQNLLQHIKRQKEQRTLDPKHDMMIDSAMAESKPSELDGGAKPAKRIKQRTKKELFLRYLLFEKLTRQNVVTVASLIRKFDWADPKTLPMVVHAMRKVHLAKYPSIPVFATLTRSLDEHLPEVPVVLVDNILESIRLGLELCPPVTDGTQPFSPQKRLLELKFFGDLYVCGVVNDGILYDTLYTLLYYAGWADPPGYYFRIRMICTVLENTMAKVFGTRVGTRRMYRFLPYFYRYVHAKAHPFPVDLDFKLAEVMEMLQGHAKLLPGKGSFATFPPSLEAANALVDVVEAVLRGDNPGAGGGKERLLGGKNPPLLAFVRNLQNGVGNAGAPFDGKKQLLSSSIVPFRTQIYPLAMPGAHGTAVNDEETEDTTEDEKESSVRGKKNPKQSLDGSFNEAPPTERPADGASKPGCEQRDDDEEEEEEDPSQDEDYSRGKFLIPIGTSMSANSNRPAKKLKSEEDAEFDVMFKEAMKDSLDTAKHNASLKQMRGSHRLDDRIAQNMNIPLASIVKAGQQQQQQQQQRQPPPRVMRAPARAPRNDSDSGDSDGYGAAAPAARASVPYTVVLRRRAERSTGVDIGKKSVSVGVLNVPSGSSLAANQGTRQRVKDEAEDARRRTLELQEQAQAEEAKDEYPRYRRSGR
ncbi:Regulator of nonsense transcripts UPF2 [Diplonema papillatum]|nr:Regulator of nonsense transcripts UPF2 [Diplonema papillatum]